MYRIKEHDATTKFKNYRADIHYVDDENWSISPTVVRNSVKIYVGITYDNEGEYTGGGPAIMQ